MFFKTKRFLIIATLLTGFMPATSHADFFVWEDAKHHLSVSFPDQWVKRNNKYPGDILTITGPGENDHAQCRLNVQEDGRFAIYPQRYSDNIQRIAFSKEFWQDQLARYDNANIHKFHDNAGLGRGFGSWAMASYTTATGPAMDKTAIMFMSHYNNKTYVVECSAEKHSYRHWHNSFLNIVKSVDFRKEIHELPTGNYRNFLGESVMIRGPRDIDVSYY